MTPTAADRWILAGLLLLAAALRLVVASLPILHHADELWQYLEPAHHLVVGPWVETWEWRGGARSWLIPSVLAAPMGLGLALAPDGMIHVWLARALLALASLGIVASAFLFGRRLSCMHALIAGFVAAIWFELVYFAPRTLSEPIAAALILPAAWLVSADRRSARRLAVAGLLLGLAVAVRFQTAPLVLVLLVAAIARDGRTAILPLALGLAGAVAADAAANLAQGMPPLWWMVESLRLNLIANRSANYGTEPWWWYGVQAFRLWGFATLPIAILAGLGGRRYPWLLAAAIVHVAAHSLIPHKEWRFLLPAVALLMVLAGIGTGELLARLRATPAAIAGAALAWLAASAAGATSSTFRDEWAAGTALTRSMRIAHDVSGACGLALYRPPHPLRAAYVLYRRATPIYVVESVGPAFNVVLAPGATPLPPAYRLRGCAEGSANFCVFARRGGCDPAGAERFRIERVLAERGE